MFYSGGLEEMRKQEGSSCRLQDCVPADRGKSCKATRNPALSASSALFLFPYCLLFSDHKQASFAFLCPQAWSRPQVYTISVTHTHTHTLIYKYTHTSLKLWESEQSSRKERGRGEREREGERKGEREGESRWVELWLVSPLISALGLVALSHKPLIQLPEIPQQLRRRFRGKQNKGVVIHSPKDVSHPD